MSGYYNNARANEGRSSYVYSLKNVICESVLSSGRKKEVGFVMLGYYN